MNSFSGITIFLVIAYALLISGSDDFDTGFSNFPRQCIRACPDIYSPVCASNGEKITKFANDCELETFNCLAALKRQNVWERIPSVICNRQNDNLNVAVATSEPKPKNCERPCTKILSPTCGFDGRTYRTFNSPCMMEMEACETGRKWVMTSFSACSSVEAQKSMQSEDIEKKCARICTLEYMPICGYDGQRSVTFANKCDLEMQNCLTNNRFRVLRMGEC